MNPFISDPTSLKECSHRTSYFLNLFVCNSTKCSHTVCPETHLWESMKSQSCLAVAYFYIWFLHDLSKISCFWRKSQGQRGWTVAKRSCLFGQNLKLKAKQPSFLIKLCIVFKAVAKYEWRLRVAKFSTILGSNVRKTSQFSKIDESSSEFLF